MKFHIINEAGTVDENRESKSIVGPIGCVAWVGEDMDENGNTIEGVVLVGLAPDTIPASEDSMEHDLANLFAQTMSGPEETVTVLLRESELAVAEE